MFWCNFVPLREVPQYSKRMPVRLHGPNVDDGSYEAGHGCWVLRIRSFGSSLRQAETKPRRPDTGRTFCPYRARLVLSKNRSWLHFENWKGQQFLKARSFRVMYASSSLLCLTDLVHTDSGLDGRGLNTISGWAGGRGWSRWF